MMKIDGLRCNKRIGCNAHRRHLSPLPLPNILFYGSPMPSHLNVPPAQLLALLEPIVHHSLHIALEPLAKVLEHRRSTRQHHVLK